MPDYLVELEDGRKFRVKSKTPLSEEEVTSYALGQQAPSAAPASNQPGRLGSFASNVGRGALSVIPGTIGGVGYALGLDTLIGAADTIEGGINRMLPVNPEYQDETLMKVGNVLGQAGGMLATGGAAGAAGKSLALSRGLSQAAAAAKGTQLASNLLLGTGVAQGIRGGGQEAEKYKMQGGTAYARALLGGAIEGLSERALFGMGTELAPVKKFLGDAVEKGVGSIAKAAGTEAGEEAVAQIGGNVATSVLAPYGVQTPGALEGAGEAALLGGVAGGALGGVNALMQAPQTVEGDALFPPEQAPPPVEEPEDDYGVAAFQQQMNEIAAQPDPIEPLQQTVTKAAESSVRANADVLPATAAVIEAGGLAPQRETFDQVRARIRLSLSAEERADMEEKLAQAQDEGILADVFAEERRKAVAREDFLRRQQDLEAERQRLEDEGILGDVFAEERQRATAREQQRQQPPVVEETIAPEQPIPAVEETVAPEITPEQVPNVENVIDEPGAAEVGLGMEEPTPKTGMQRRQEALDAGLDRRTADALGAFTDIAEMMREVRNRTPEQVKRDWMGYLEADLEKFKGSAPRTAPESSLFAAEQYVRYEKQKDGGFKVVADEATWSPPGEKANPQFKKGTVIRKFPSVDALFEYVRGEAAQTPAAQATTPTPTVQRDVTKPAPQPEPAAEVETPVVEVPALEVRTGEGAKTADVRLALHRADKHYTLWVSHKRADGTYTPYQYISILGQDFDAAYDKAVAKANSVAAGEKLNVAFEGQNVEGARASAKSVGVLDKALSKEALEDLTGGAPMGKQLVGFGKYSSLTVDEMVAKDIGYADWVANNASTGRGAKVAQYIRERNPAYIEWRDAKNVQDATKEAAGQSERERIKAFEQRATQKPAAKPLDTKNTTTDNKVVVKRTPKLTSRKAKDQIVDIVPAQDSPSYVPESLTKNMFPSQVSGANAVIDALEKTGAALNGDGAGVGKTRQILAVASHYAAQGKPVVIITENAAIGKPWEGAKGKTNPTLGGSMAKDGQAMGVDVKLMPDAGFTGPGIYISTYNRVTDAQIPEGAVLIFDESQGLVNVYDDADLNKELGQWQQKFRTILNKAEKTAFYSATPADKPHQMSYLYKVLGYDSPQDFLVDARKNGLTVKTTKFGKTETKKYDIPFSSVKRTMLFRWVNNLMKKAGLSSSFIKREISYEGTDTQFHDVQGTDTSKNPWAENFKEVVDELESHQRNGWRLLAPDSYLLYAAELTKIGEAVRMVKRELAAGRKAVLYFSRIKEQEIRGRQFLGFDPMDGTQMFSDVTVLGTIPSPVDLLREELKKEGIDFTELHSKSGDTSATAQKKFAGDTNVLLASVESGGTGINLDDPTGKTPRTEIFMFAPYRGISTVQAMGRIWRASTVQDDNKPNRYVFLVASDIKQDAMRSAILAKKLQLMDASLGGTAVSRLPMSKVNYSPDQLVGMELPEEGVEVERIEADKTKKLKPVDITFKTSAKGNLWAPATADLLEWYEAGGPERTGLNITVFQAKEDGKPVPGKWIALSEKQYAPEEFALPAETQEVQSPAQEFGSTNTVVTKETKDKAAKSLRKKLGGQTNVGIDPSILKDAVTIGTYYIEGGARSFADFSAKMLEEFGANIQKYIRPAYEALRKRTDIDTAGMDAEEGGEPATKVEEPKTPPPPAPKAETPKVEPTQAAPKPTTESFPTEIKLTGQPERPQASVVPPDNKPVGFSNAEMDAEAARIVGRELVRPVQEAISDDALWAQATAEFKRDSDSGRRLVTSLVATPRVVSSKEQAMLGMELVRRKNVLNAAATKFLASPEGDVGAKSEYETAQRDYDDALYANSIAGSDTARALRFRRLTANMDMELESMLNNLKAVGNKADLSKEQVAEASKIAKEYEANAKAVDALRKQAESTEAARLAEAEKVAFEAGRQEVLKDIEERAKNEAERVAEMQKRKAEYLAAKKEAAKTPSKWEEIRAAARARNAELRSNLYSDVVLVKVASMAVNDVIIGATYIAEGVTKFADWVSKMRSEDINLTDDEMQQLFKESKAFDAGEDLPASEAPLKVKKAKAPTIDKVKAIAADEEALDSRTVYNLVVDKMKARVEANPALEKVEMSTDDLTSVISEVTADVQEFFPGITEREIRDLFSGYGTILEPSKDELAKQMRQLTALGRLNSAIEDAIADLIPLKSGVQRDRATQAIRLQQKKLARELRMMGRDYEASEEQLRSPLDAMKARVNNQINDLDYEIRKGRKNRRPTPDADPELEKLIELRDELKRLSDFLNAPAGPTFTELVQDEKDKLDKRIGVLEKALERKQFMPKEDRKLYTQELQVKRDKRDELNEQIRKLRKIEADKSRTQEDIDRAAIASVKESIAELDRKIKEKDFARPERRTPTETAEYLALVAKKEALQDTIKEERLKLLGRKGLTDEQRVKQATAAVDKSIERMQKMLDSGNYDVPKRTSKTPETPALKAKRDARDKLRKQLLELRKLKRDALIDPIAKQLKTDKKRIQTRMDKLKKRMETGDFSKPVKREKPTDPELLELLAKEEKLKERWGEMLLNHKLSQRSRAKRYWDNVFDLFSMGRFLKTSTDLSAIANQGNFALFSHPVLSMRQLGGMWKAMQSDTNQKIINAKIRELPEYKSGEMKRAGLYLSLDAGPNDPLQRQEEAMASRWIDKIPKRYGGGILRATSRAYTTYLDLIRVATYLSLKNNLVEGGWFMQPQETTPERLQSVANLINNGTGRGSLGSGRFGAGMSQAAPFLNTFLFALRFGVSRFVMALGIPLWTASKGTKVLIAKEYTKYLAGLTTAMILYSMFQDEDDKEMEFDPTSSDFGKVLFDNQRVDVMGGFQQPLVFLLRLLFGEYKNSKGLIKPLREGDRPLNLFRETPLTDKPKFTDRSGAIVVGDFLRYKLSPTASLLLNTIQGKTPVGERTDLMSEVITMPVPLIIDQMYETAKAQQDDPFMAALLMGSGVVGVRTSNQDPKEDRSKAKTAWEQLIEYTKYYSGVK